MAKNTAAIKVGRLLEVRAAAGYRTVSDVDELFDAIDAEVMKLPAKLQIVTVADWRECHVMARDTSERLLQRIKALNARTERSVALATPDGAVAVLQFMRLIRESQLPDRKMFFEADEVTKWLSEVLSPPEQQRLRQFLLEGARRASPDSGPAAALRPTHKGS